MARRRAAAYCVGRVASGCIGLRGVYVCRASQKPSDFTASVFGDSSVAELGPRHRDPIAAGCGAANLEKRGFVADTPCNNLPKPWLCLNSPTFRCSKCCQAKPASRRQHNTPQFSPRNRGRVIHNSKPMQP
ncbi:hypothetical protein F5144DRAFT_127899 [Chaetomium tenue]|uniref:Uncharacterized protein n=1 Tax=Chaetomium tenue TaxID=1854479 RepID=A0ACB7PML3_9PEZI|nr:hypothetical protein F5144DRAFT_127899 [Chaetomium globosum]